MVDVTYRTLGPWGAGKGANLQPSEVDANFYSLAQAIVNIQDNPEEPNGIYSITVSGTQMTITLNDGTVLGPYTLPVLTFRWRGEWDSFATYDILDVFTVTNLGIFMVQVYHTGTGATFDPDRVTDENVPYYIQLFGSVDASLSALPDVELTDLESGDVLWWDGFDPPARPPMWRNIHLGEMAFQEPWEVDIRGGTITGLPPPIDPMDAVNKAYVDALPAGMTAPDNTVMANIAGYIAAAIPNTLSDVLDSTMGTSVRGALLHRTDTGWVALPPGPAGNFLQTFGPGLDVAWGASGAGVTEINAGTGISTGLTNITSTGFISLAAVPDDTLLANTSGVSSAPVPTTLAALLDSALGSSRGLILARGAAGWAALSPGTAGQFLKTQGSGADVVWDSPSGSGTVLSVAAGTGLTTGGSPITSTGTMALAAIATASLLANVSGSSAAPVPLTASLFFDSVFSSTQGAVLYRSATGWVALSPGTAGQFLATGGASANPSWQPAPITGSSTPNLRIVSNISGATAVPTGNTLTNILDAIISSARGTLIYRTNSGWTGLAPGTLGQVLQTGGPSADPSWAANGASSIVISSPVSRDVLSYNPSSGKFENVRPRYEIGAYVPGVPSASQNLLFHKFSKAVTLPANLGAHLGHTTVAGSGSPATATTALTLARAPSGSPTTFSTVATISFSAGSVVGSMSTQAAIAFGQGDVLRVRAAASPDATFADVHLSLVGFET